MVEELLADAFDLPPLFFAEPPPLEVALLEEDAVEVELLDADSLLACALPEAVALSFFCDF